MKYRAFRPPPRAALRVALRFADVTDAYHVVHAEGDGQEADGAPAWLYVYAGPVEASAWITSGDWFRR
ncbi:MAG: hypothetical protein ACYTDU_21270 [Planctomycetota bacterium]